MHRAFSRWEKVMGSHRSAALTSAEAGCSFAHAACHTAIERWAVPRAQRLALLRRVEGGYEGSNRIQRQRIADVDRHNAEAPRPIADLTIEP